MTVGPLHGRFRFAADDAEEAALAAAEEKVLHL